MKVLLSPSVDMVVGEWRGLLLIELLHLRLDLEDLGHGTALPDCPQVALTIDQELGVRTWREEPIGRDDLGPTVGHDREQHGRRRAQLPDRVARGIGRYRDDLHPR